MMINLELCFHVDIEIFVLLTRHILIFTFLVVVYRIIQLKYVPKGIWLYMTCIYICTCVCTCSILVYEGPLPYSINSLRQ